MAHSSRCSVGRGVLLLLVLGLRRSLASAAQIVEERPTRLPWSLPAREPSERSLLNTSQLPSPPEPTRPPPDERVVACEDGSTHTLRDAESRPAKCWPVNESATAAVSGSPRATARDAVLQAARLAPDAVSVAAMRLTRATRAMRPIPRAGLGA